MSDKITQLRELMSNASNDCSLVMRRLEETPNDKGLLKCLGQAKHTLNSCKAMIMSFLRWADDGCEDCNYYPDRFVKRDGTVNEWCVHCAQETKPSEAIH